jgi:hypothetical protein
VQDLTQLRLSRLPAEEQVERLVVALRSWA